MSDPDPQPPSARLVVVDGNGAGRRWTISDRATIGRSPDCDVVVDDPGVSRRHARIVREEDSTFSVEDLGSRNGTSVEGEPIERAQLSFGDEIRLGPNQRLRLARFDPVEDEIFSRQRLETLGRLSAGLAHDVNNMLGAVNASVACLRRIAPEQRGEPEAIACLDDIEDATQRASELSSQLLSFAGPRNDREPTDLAPVCMDCVRLARRTFSRRVEIRANVQPNLLVDGDVARLHQAIMNLLFNARDAIEASDGRLIEVTAEREEGDGESRVVIAVTDDGPGMSEDTRARIFEPFFTTKREGVGFGVGLATVRDALEEHGGTVEVQTTVGAGSTFRLSLPALSGTRNASGRAAQYSGERQTGEASDGLVLLVDDERVLRRSVARVLRRSGFSIEEAEDGETALERLDQSPRPALVVLDLDLPGMRGQDVLAEMRRRGDGTPVVCISGHRDALVDDEETNREIAAFVPKPFDSTLFVHTVAAALGSPDDEGITLTS